MQFNGNPQYIFICMYRCIVFSMVICASTNYLDSATNSTWVLRTKSEVALTTAADSSIVHTLWKKRKRNEREGGNGRGKPDRISLNYKKARLEVRIIAKQRSF